MHEDLGVRALGFRCRMVNVVEAISRTRTSRGWKGSVQVNDNSPIWR